MDYLQNHCWCSQSHWDGETYLCRHIVSFSGYDDECKEDYANLIIEKSDQYLYASKHDGFGRDHYRDAPNLRPDILEWLVDNVKDRKGEDNPKGWCVGDADYRGTGSSCFSVFFHRKSDAMAFIKKYSVYKKPVYYCQYFSDDRKQLDLKSMRYKKVTHKHGIKLDNKL